MNLIIIDPSELTAGHMVSLADHRARHIREVLGKRPGDTVRAGVVGGGQGTAEILAVGEVVQLHFVPPASPPPEPPLDLILALPRPVMFRRILTQAAPLGVARLWCIRSRRVERSFFQSPVLHADTSRQLLREGMAQAMTTWEPQLAIHQRFRPFIEDVLPPSLANVSHRFLLHPDPGAPPCPMLAAGERVLAAVGPEGGWVDYEVQRFRDLGFQPVHLGERILRVDTAVAFLAGFLAGRRSGPPAAVRDQPPIPGPAAA